MAPAHPLGSTSEPGECCNAEIATSRSRCSCCRRASCSCNSRSSSLVIGTADSGLAATAGGPKLGKSIPFYRPAFKPGGVRFSNAKSGLLRCTTKPASKMGSEGVYFKGQASI